MEKQSPILVDFDEMDTLLGPSSRKERCAVLEQKVLPQVPNSHTRKRLAVQDDSGELVVFELVRRNSAVFDVVPHAPFLAA